MKAFIGPLQDTMFPGCKFGYHVYIGLILYPKVCIVTLVHVHIHGRVLSQVHMGFVVALTSYNFTIDYHQRKVVKTDKRR